MPKTTMNLRIDSHLKESAEKITNELGISMATAITLYLKALVREKGIPFSVTLDEKKKPTPKSIPSFSLEEEEEPLPNTDDVADQDALKNAIDKL